MRLFYFVADAYPAWRVDLVELFCVQLRQRGVETTWSTRRDDAGLLGGVDMHGQTAIQPFSLGKKGVAAKALNRLLEPLSELLIFLRLLFGKSHDIIQVRDDRYSAAFFALLAARLRGARFTYWLSFPFPEHDLAMAAEATGARRIFLRLRGGFARWWLYRVILPATDHVFVQSPRMRENIARMGIPEAKMTPVPMGVPPRLMDWLKAVHCEVVPGRILYLGTLAASRKLEILVEAFARVREAFPYATLMFVGDGDFPHERLGLERRVRELGLEDAVTFTGFIPMEQAWQWVATAEVCVSPIAPCNTLDVASPTKLVEYMTFGKPVVVNTHPEQTEILHACDVGELVSWSAEGFAEAIRRLLADPARAAARAAKGPGWVRAHRTYDRIAETVLARYRTLTGRAAAAEPIAKPSHTETP
jgi:glycosyltransferase involved in cell wall biosynthesis